ncbi:MAG: VOC family protein [Alphaproteobacteria bacterium]|nr:VOC family protein [Alphaproteobacteria bacterium]
MAKAIHAMIRVLDEDRAVGFYQKAFALKVANRYEFDDFTLIYMANEANDYWLELTVKPGQTDPNELGKGYTHIAFTFENLDDQYCRLRDLRFDPGEIKKIQRDGELFARYFFINDPDGNKIQVLERSGPLDRNDSRQRSIADRDGAT